MSKKIAVAAIIILLCLSLTGCGIGEDLRFNFTQASEASADASYTEKESSATETNSETKTDSDKKTEPEKQESIRTLAFKFDYDHQIVDTMTYVYENGYLARIEYTSGRIRCYDPNGNLIKDETSEYCKIYEYDERGNLIYSEDPSDGVMHYTYDDQDRMLSKETETDYGTSGMMAEMMGVRVEYEYSADGLRCDSWVYNSLGQAIRHGILLYNEYGDIVSEEVYRLNKDPIELATENYYEYDYDRDGHLIYKSTGGGTYTTYEYDGAGQLTKETNFFTRAGIGHEEQIYWSTLYEYNADGKIVKISEQVTIDGVELAAVPTRINTYDANGNLTGSFYYEGTPYDLVDYEYVSITRSLNKWSYAYVYVYDDTNCDDPYSLIPAEYR